MRSFIALLLVAAGDASLLMAQSAGDFTATGNMVTARYGHTATLLLSGKVLIAGGSPRANHPLASAEVYDPFTNTFNSTGNMITARRGHTATLLPDGRVLIVGGTQTVHDLASAELYDPSTGTFTATGNMTTVRSLHSATLLANGKVLVAGGGSAELYDPATSTFAVTGRYPERSYDAVPLTATLLTDGKVLITGSDALLYDPSTGIFSITAPIVHNWLGSTATLLTNGKVLVAGGGLEECTGDTAEVYDSTGTITASTKMNTCRMQHTANLLPDGTVLVSGSQYPNAFALATAERYDPVTTTFSPTGNMVTARFWHTATLLTDGTVLLAGGWSNPYPAGATSSAEIYKPPSLVPAPVLFSLSGDGQGQGAILHASTHEVVSPCNPAVADEVLEIYGTGLLDGSGIPPQVTFAGRVADVLFFGRAPGYAGLNQINARVPASVAPGPAVSVRLNYLSRPSNEVTIAVVR